MERIAGLQYQLLQDVIKEVIIRAALDLCEVVPSLGPFLLSGSLRELCCGYCLSFWLEPLGRKNQNLSRDGDIHPRMHYYPHEKYFLYCTYIGLHLLNQTLAGPWTRHFPVRQTIFDSRCGEGNECQVHFINQWSIFDSYLSYAIEVYPVNKIHNISRCKSRLAVLNWSSRQRFNMEGTLNLPHECLWGTSTCPQPMARVPFSGSL